MAHTNINILQWNARSITANKNSLTRYISLHPQFSIIAVSETHLKPNQPFRFQNFTSFRADRNHMRGGGAALLVHTSIAAQQTTINTTMEAVAVTVRYRNFPITIVSVYMSPTAQPPHEQAELSNLLQQIPQPAIVCGDFNAHIKNYCSLRTDSRGHCLQRVATNLNYTIMNTDHPTLQHCPGHAPSAPDFTLISDQLLPHFSWQVLDLTLGSDHYLISISDPVLQQPPPTIPPPPRRNFSQANWETYSRLLQTLLPKIDEPDIDCRYEAFISTLNFAAATSIPLKKQASSFHKHVKKGWWNESCETSYNNMTSAQKSFRRDPASMEKYIASKKYTAMFKKISKEAKLMHWRAVCSTLSRTSNPTHIWNVIKKLQNKQTPPSNPSLTNQTWEDEFLDRVAPADQPSAPPLDFQELQGTCMRPTFPYNSQPFTPTELEIVLSSSNKNSAPGPDNISYSMLSHLPLSGKQILLSIYNTLITANYCPAAWKTASLKPILKAGHRPNEEKSYRPILFTSCVAKLFEMLLKKRLTAFLESNKLLPDSQHGFRKGHNIQVCLADLVSSVQMSFEQNQYHFAVMADVKGAFDNVPHTPLLEELYFIGLPPPLIKWLQKFLSQRTLIYHSPTKGTLTRPINKGVPQGGVLSPVFYIVYIRTIDNYVPRPITNTQFADDGLHHFGSANMAHSRQLIKETVEELYSFYAQRDLELNTSKTYVMVFSKKKLALRPITTRYGDIDMRDTGKYLGILLDHQLAWKNHINSIVKRCQTSLNIIKSVAYVWWGADPACLLQIYKALILSKLQTSSFIWQNAAQKDLKQLELLQNVAMRKILGTLHSTPIHSMQAETNLKPLKYAAQQEAEKVVLKLQHLGNQHALENIIHLAERAQAAPQKSPSSLLIKAYKKWSTSGIQVRQQKCSPYTPPQDLGKLIPPTLWMDFPRKNLPPQTLQLIRAYLNTEAKSHIKIFTDGSKQDDGSTGSAFYSRGLNVTVLKRPPNTYSIFSAEGLALRSTLEYIETKSKEQPILICTDSQSLLKTLANIKSIDSKNFLIADIRALLEGLTTSGYKLSLVWIPSHIGVSGNETVDKLAKLSCKINPVANVETPLPDLFNQIAHDLCMLWDINWRVINLTKGRAYAQLFPEGHLPKTPWFAKFRGYPRTFYTSINRLRVAHVTSPDRLFSWNLVPTPACACSHTPGTLDHLLFHCPRFCMQRRQLTNCLASLNLQPPQTLPMLLSSLVPEVYLALHELYKEIFPKY